MSKHGKKFLNIVKKIDNTVKYTITEACELIKSFKIANFNESVDISVNLGVDPRHADQNIRSSVILPHGVGRNIKVIVFAKGLVVQEAINAGADYVGAEDLALKIEEGFTDFNKVVASPDMMSIVGRLGKILGPRGLMPNPKIGTITVDVVKAVKEIKAGKIEFRADKTGNLHASLGRVTFSLQHLQDNINTFFSAVMRVKPSSLKGLYIKRATLSSTMGPGLQLDISKLSLISKK